MDYKIVKARTSDIPAIVAVEKSAWGDLAATEEIFEVRISTFPQGVMVAKKKDGSIIGVIVVCIRRYDKKVIFDSTKPAPNWLEATGRGLIAPVHDLRGNVVYGVDLSVRRGVMGRGVGHALFRATFQRVVVEFNKRYYLGGVRMPHYHKHAAKLTPEEYVKAKNSDGTYLDPELQFYLPFKYAYKKVQVARLIPDYFPDPESKNYGVLCYWENPYYRGS